MWYKKNKIEETFLDSHVEVNEEEIRLENIEASKQYSKNKEWLDKVMTNLEKELEERRKKSHNAWKRRIKREHAKSEIEREKSYQRKIKKEAAKIRKQKRYEKTLQR